MRAHGRSSPGTSMFGLKVSMGRYLVRALKLMCPGRGKSLQDIRRFIDLHMNVMLNIIRFADIICLSGASCILGVKIIPSTCELGSA